MAFQTVKILKCLEEWSESMTCEENVNLGQNI